MSITPSGIPTSPSKSSFIFQALIGSDITDEMIDTCAGLFSANYGIWGEKAAHISKYTKLGEPVKMSGKRLRAQCVSMPEQTILVTCSGHTGLLGHAFATVWEYSGGVVGWITQLVVDKTMRRRYIATQLLQTLKSHSLFRNVTAVGLVSSHPAACNALAKYAGISTRDIDLGFIRDNAANILRYTTVGYLKEVELRGTLFQESPDPASGKHEITYFELI